MCIKRIYNIFRLETMRYYPHTMNSARYIYLQPIIAHGLLDKLYPFHENSLMKICSVGDPAPLIEAHQNSLNCLLYALRFISRNLTKFKICLP